MIGATLASPELTVGLSEAEASRRLAEGDPNLTRQMFLFVRFTTPNSVSTHSMSLCGAVTILPGGRFSTRRLRRSPLRSYVEDMQTNDFPPLKA